MNTHSQTRGVAGQPPSRAGGRRYIPTGASSSSRNRLVRDLTQRPQGDGPVLELGVIGDIAAMGMPAEHLAHRIANAGSSSIRLVIDSNGGELITSYYAARAIAQHSYYVEAHIVGAANSAALLFAMAADRRLIASHGRIVLHPPTYETFTGTASELRKLANALEEHERLSARTVSNATGLSFDEVLNWMQNTTTFNGVEAVHIGLCDDLTREYAPTTPRARRITFCAGDSRCRSVRNSLAPPQLFHWARIYQVGDFVRHKGKTYIARERIAGTIDNEPGLPDVGWDEV